MTWTLSWWTQSERTAKPPWNNKREPMNPHHHRLLVIGFWSFCCRWNKHIDENEIFVFCKNKLLNLHSNNLEIYALLFCIDAAQSAEIRIEILLPKWQSYIVFRFGEFKNEGHQWSRKVHYNNLRAGAHYQEAATPLISQCNGIFTDQAIFRYFSGEIGQFQSTGARFGKDKTMWPHVNMSTLGLQLVTEVPVTIWIRDKFKLKMDRSVKMPRRKYGVVAGS